MFEVKVNDLNDLFDQDNVRDGSSLKKIKEWGGIQGLQKILKTSFKKGLQESEGDREKRISSFGDNQPITKPPKTLWSMIIETFQDDMLRILCVAAVVSLVLGVLSEGIQTGWMEGASILVAVVLIVTVTSGNNWVKQQQFIKLNAIASKKNVNILKNGDWINMSVYDAVVGDIQYIQTGEILSVDGVLIQSNNLLADESSMTGQTDAIKKKVPSDYTKENCFLISGCKIMEGTGSILILAVGKNSQYGKLKLKIQGSNDQTPLQEKLTILANQVGEVGMWAAAATFLCMLGHILHDAYISESFTGNLFRIETLHHLVQAFIIAVSIIVVAVPEGLPLAVTIALAYSVGKMKDQNNLVRYLQACQTMGGADNICSDKTGTLTKNSMTVVRFFGLGNVHQQFKKQMFSKEYTKLLCKSICHNSNATPIIQGSGSFVKINQIGNKTECALLLMAHQLGFEYKQHRSKQEIIKIFPFSSAIKSMTTISQVDGTRYTFTKGAPDFLLPRCKSYLDKNGKSVNITEEYKEQLNQHLLDFANLSLRTLLLAYRQGGNQQAAQEDLADGLTILGMVGIKDPLRDGIKKAVHQCEQAGVTVRMITGDNQNTAVAIAREAGILAENYQSKQNDCVVMTGKEFRNFVGGLVSEGGEDSQKVGNIENFKKVAKNLRVLARSSPQDKYLMATGLKELGHVVAMTGDGTNDAPALKKADIGFAMGIAGTQVAKEAAGIILLDDNFSSIVTAMKWGRNIFDSIRKFLQFQLTVNMVALVLAFLGAAILKESPLNPIQMLWVNLIMDTMAALALATEPPTDQLLKRKPYSRRENLITPTMWRNIIAQGLLQIIILGAILFRGPQIFGIQSSIGVGTKDWNEDTGKHYSIFFNVFVLLQVFNEINARKLKSSELNVFANFFNNSLFLIIMAFTLVVQYFCVEFGGQAVKTVPLSLNEHLMCLGLGSLSIFAGFFFKLMIPASLFKGLSKMQE